MSQYIYVLINPSLRDMVKIGRTNRDVDQRAAEISAATGVPTPFIVAYESEVSDSVLAERQIHDELAARGFRVNERREFFAVPVKVAVEIVSRVAANLTPASEIQTSSFGAGDGDENVVDKNSFIEQLLEDGHVLLEGDADEGILQDQKAARLSYERAAKLGSAEANYWLAKLYEEGQGVPASLSKALEYYLAAEKAGYIEAYGPLRKIYLGEQDPSFKNWTNAEVMFGRYLKVADLNAPYSQVGSYIGDCLTEKDPDMWSKEEKVPIDSINGKYLKAMIEEHLVQLKGFFLRAREARLAGVPSADFGYWIPGNTIGSTSYELFELNIERLEEQDYYMRKLLADVDWLDLEYVKKADVVDQMYHEDLSFCYNYQLIYPDAPLWTGKTKVESVVAVEEEVIAQAEPEETVSLVEPTPEVEVPEYLPAPQPDPFVAVRDTHLKPKQTGSF